MYKILPMTLFKPWTYDVWSANWAITTAFNIVNETKPNFPNVYAMDFFYIFSSFDSIYYFKDIKMKFKT